MNALVIYDSKFGNTHHVAQAIGEALEDTYAVRVESVSDVTELPADLSLLVIGGPTHAHGISQPMKEFLAQLSTDKLRDVPVATFDTLFHKPKLLVGAASEGIAKRLRKQGARLVAEPESFWVESGEGPMEAGELDRAGAWAREIATTAAVPVS
jgi:flavodoxin